MPGFRIPPAYWDTLRAGGGGGPQICSLCGPDVLTVPITGFTSYQIAKTGNNYTYFGVWTSPNSKISVVVSSFRNLI